MVSIHPDNIPCLKGEKVQDGVAWKSERRLTWSWIHLWRTLDHWAAGQTGQHHRRHYLIHLNRLGAAETKTQHGGKKSAPSQI